MLSEVEKIPPVAMGLPNGAYTAANEKGSASLGEDLKLKNVLHVTNLKCNLVSI